MVKKPKIAGHLREVNCFKIMTYFDQLTQSKEQFTHVQKIFMDEYYSRVDFCSFKGVRNNPDVEGGLIYFYNEVDLSILQTEKMKYDDVNFVAEVLRVQEIVSQELRNIQQISSCRVRITALFVASGTRLYYQCHQSFRLIQKLNANMIRGQI